MSGKYNTFVSMQTNEVQKVLDICLEAGASDARIIHTVSDQTSVSLFNCDVDKIHNASDCSVFLQLFVDGRYGTFSTNMLDEASLRPFIASMNLSVSLKSQSPLGISTAAKPLFSSQSSFAL